jgi:hypothetical protein
MAGNANNNNFKVTIENFEDQRGRKDSLLAFGNPTHLKVEDE